MKMFSTFFSALAEKMAACYGMTAEQFLAQEVTRARTTTSSMKDEVKSALRERINRDARHGGRAARLKNEAGFAREQRRAARRAERRMERAYERALTIIAEKDSAIGKLKDELADAEMLAKSMAGIIGSSDKFAAFNTPVRVLRRALSRAIFVRDRLAGRGFAALVERVAAAYKRWDAEDFARRTAPFMGLNG